MGYTSIKRLGICRVTDFTTITMGEMDNDND